MYNRISIVGGSGSGKSTLCDILSEKFSLPAVHLDSINFKPNWIEIDKNERDKIISAKALEDKWIDGNYTKTLKLRFEKADLIIWLDYSTFSLVKGVFKRYFKLRNKDREEIPGCQERITFDFIKYVATYNKKKRHIIEELLMDVSPNKVLIFKNQKNLNNWIYNKILPVNRVIFYCFFFLYITYPLPPIIPNAATVPNALFSSLALDITFSFVLLLSLLFSAIF